MSETTGLALQTEEQDILREELRRLQAQLPESERAELAALGEAVERGEVPFDLLPSFEQLLWFLLERGEVRAFHRAEGERSLNRLFQRTVLGQQLQAKFRELNQALTALRGQTLERISVSMRRPGCYRIQIQTDQMGLVLLASWEGVEVESMEV